MKRILLPGLLSLCLGLLAACNSGETPEPAETAPAPVKTDQPAQTNSQAAEAEPAEEPEPEQTAPQKSAEEVAVLKTSKGTMVVAFWPDVAPKTVENFKKLAGQGFYDGTSFHRIIKGFMIQGGDPMTKRPELEQYYGQGNPGYTIPAEFNERPHERGVLSMARGGDPDSAGSQFFIVLDRAPHLDNKYTGFGKLIEGEDVLMSIGETPVGPNAGGEMSKPQERVVLESVKIVPKESYKEAMTATPEKTSETQPQPVENEGN